MFLFNELRTLLLNPIINSLLTYLMIVIGLSSFFLKIFLLYFFTKKQNLSLKYKTIIPLVVIILTSAYSDLAYSIYAIHLLIFNIIPLWLSTSLLRIVLFTTSILFHTFLFFFRELSSNKIKLRYIKILIPITSAFTLYFLYNPIQIIYAKTVLPLNWQISKCHSFYYIFLGFLSTLLLIRNYKLEKIILLKKQILTLLIYFMVPYIITGFLDSYFISPKANFKTAITLSAIMTYMLYYCIKKLTYIRFLDIENHVTSPTSKKFTFPNHLVKILDTLKEATSIQELVPITKNFFSKTFEIPRNNIHLYFRKKLWQKNDISKQEEDYKGYLVEKALEAAPNIINYLKKNKILIYNEIEYSVFSQEQNLPKVCPEQQIFNFLNEIQTDLFIPIFIRNKFLAYIIMDKNGANELFSDLERDEMLIYSDHLGATINFFSQLDPEILLQQEQQLKLKLLQKNRELELLKNSYSFFKNNESGNKIGILTYVNKKFNYCNNEAKEILKTDLNKDKGLEITSTISQIASETFLYGIPSRTLLYNFDDEPVIVSSNKNLTQHNALISISKPTIQDFISEKLPLLNNTSKWHYLISLYTTNEGKIVNDLLPADTKIILNCKTNFLELAITSQNILLEMNPEDASAFAHATHKIKNLFNFEEIIVNKQNAHQMIFKLFGLNSMIEQKNQGLLQTLTNGTLFIQNIDLLDIKTQEKLLEFIVTGKSQFLKEKKSENTNISLVFSTNENLYEQVLKGLFINDLYKILKKNYIKLPILRSLPTEEFLELSEGLRHQIIYNKMYKNLLVLSTNDKNKLLNSRCISLLELKTKIKTILLQKTKLKNVEETKVIDPAYNIPDYELMEAVRLGKHALKDRNMLKMLMEKFKYSQSKVAQFLGVNRSSVNRRCIEFEINLNTEKS
ncbi:sigma 54-interacting transcriptional regulator [Candidatus Babeliales bacterium]|nr:sigma 54-interacting transcriptional regulator [Candidatus Babeliales bacterium]